MKKPEDSRRSQDGFYGESPITARTSVSSLGTSSAAIPQTISNVEEQLLTSRDFIYWHLGLVHGFLEIRVSDLVDLNQINGRVEHVFQLFYQFKVAM